MNELFKVVERTVGNELVQTVNARDLHAFLEIKKDFADWIRYRINQYGFKQGIDFETFRTFGENPKGGRPTNDYAINLRMAKHLSMVQNNDRGEEARDYFLECERRAKAIVPDVAALLADPELLRTLLLGYANQNVALTAKVKEQAPKAEFHDAVTEAINCQTVQEVAKVLGTGAKRLFQFLRDEGLLMAGNLPYQRYLDAGYFRVVEKQYRDRRGESNTYTQTLIAGKGLAYIQRRIQRPGQDMMEF